MKIYVLLLLLIAPTLAVVNGPYDIPPELPPLNDENFFDLSQSEYETVLTPEDFSLGARISAAMAHDNGDVWDSDGMYNKELFEGDIANDNLNSSTVELFLNGGSGKNEEGKWYNAIKNRLQLWPSGRIPYTISSQYSSYSRSLIAASMQDYSAHTCIQWVPKEAADVNYVHIYPDRGCYSMVGKMGGKQSLSLGSGCIQKGIIIHEMMHAVGFFHEQSRTDRDDHITIMWNNIQSGMQGQFEKYGHGTIQSLGTSYDYGSIMHYGTKAFSRNGQPTMIPKKTGAQIGQRNGFSKVDKFKINTLYGCPVEGEKPTTTSGSIIQTITNKPIAVVSTARPPIVQTSSPLKPENCKNTRGDCDDLAKQGWCIRNPGWMRANCPVSCGMCIPTKPTVKPQVIAITTAPPRPATTTTKSQTSNPNPNPNPQPLPPAPPLPPTSPDMCEDLRVDCLVLVSQRYCKISQNFMKSYCAKSCGFCYKPPPTEIPNNVVGPSVVTTKPIVTLAPLPDRSSSVRDLRYRPFPPPPQLPRRPQSLLQLFQLQFPQPLSQPVPYVLTKSISAHTGRMRDSVKEYS
uniref:Metalloendopeptidase n=1 Tax=Caenorhabditis japonica TaxID=281687 RepID=A0A8R1DHG5_CAEJA